MKNYWEWEPVFHLDPRESALIIIDMQNGFVEEGAPLEVPMARKQIPNIAQLVHFFREHKIPVIYTMFYVSEDEHFDFYWKMSKQRGLKLEKPDCVFWEGKHETKIIPELRPLSGDYIIKKCGYDAFAYTDLHRLLESLGIKSLIITGTVLNWCVDSTVRSAFHHHYKIFVVEDAVSSYDHAGGTAEEWRKLELNFFAEAFGHVVSSKDLISELFRSNISTTE